MKSTINDLNIMNSFKSISFNSFMYFSIVFRSELEAILFMVITTSLLSIIATTSQDN